MSRDILIPNEASLVPPGFPFPHSSQCLRVMADWWEEHGDNSKAIQCRMEAAYFDKWPHERRTSDNG